MGAGGSWESLKEGIIEKGLEGFEKMNAMQWNEKIHG